MAAQADAHRTWITAIDDPCLPVHYATVNLWSYPGPGLVTSWEFRGIRPPARD
jgi:3,4-dihydroxyphenylacetate 2,3-dioxygenase